MSRGVARMATTTFIIFLSFVSGEHAFAWGRHDLITQLVLKDDSLKHLSMDLVHSEPIEEAAADLLKKTIPELNAWAMRYHQEHDPRYAWSIPPRLSTTTATTAAAGQTFSNREELLWALENNIKTPLDFSITADDREDAPREKLFGSPGLARSGAASEVLERYVEEPDAVLDKRLNEAPYFARLRESMSLFYDGTSHTHTFRHYFVPSSILPPLISPRGIAPYRAALYAQLAVLALRSGHRYWGYRFLAWSIHYAQDVTQPWHTVFVPASLEYLAFSKAEIRRKVASSHYLTEAASDSWLAHFGTEAKNSATSLVRFDSHRGPATRPQALWSSRARNPWIVAELVEDAAREANRECSELTRASQPLFSPIIATLDQSLKPTSQELWLGGVKFDLTRLDFAGNGVGATQFLEPMWSPKFTLANERDAFARVLSRRLFAAVDLSRRIIAYVLEQARSSSRFVF